MSDRPYGLIAMRYGVRDAGLSIWDMGLRILDWKDGGQRLLNLELGMRNEGGMV